MDVSLNTSIKTCPHCSADNAGDAAYCESCGKALPELVASGPRIVEQGGMAATRAGQAIQSAQLRKEAKKASGALLAVAILQVIFGTVLLFGVLNLASSNPEIVIGPAVYATVYGLGFIFFCLYLWARKQPLPAAIVGLVLFVSVHLLDALVDPTALARGVIVKVIIVVVLARAIKAGAHYRQLTAERPGIRNEGVDASPTV